MGRLAAILGFSLIASSLQAATWYVDSAVAASGDGKSWASAWKGLGNISGVGPGDTVYISGGGPGASKRYAAYNWRPPGGVAGRPITYKIGQEPGHKEGTAIFDGSGGSTAAFYGPIAYVVISGDAGDGAMHFAVANQAMAIYGNPELIHDTRFSYINFGSFSGTRGALLLYSYGIEIDHTYLRMSAFSANIAWHFPTLQGGPSYGSSLKFHHNEIHIPNNPNWTTDGSGHSGADGIQGSGDGYAIYNNKIFSHASSGDPGGTKQHQDLIQLIDAGYVLIYNNIFWGSSVQTIFEENRGESRNFHVFNNIISWTGNGVDVNNPVSMTGYTYLNNLVVDTDHHTRSSFMFRPGIYVDCWSANNLRFNAGADNAQGYVNHYYSNVLVSVNPFVKYVPSAYATNSDYRLSSAAVGAIRKGTNLTALVAAKPELAPLLYDFEGKPRPATGPWDVGPFQFSATTSTNPVLLVYPNSLSFPATLPGESVTNTLTVQNAGAGTLSGTASVAAPFSIVSGGAYTLGQNQSQTILVKYTPGAQASDNSSIILTGGGGAMVAVSGTRLNLQPGPTFESIAGTITYPFVAENGYISQPSGTGLSSGGTATYGFYVTNAGNYVISAQVNAPSIAANSFFVNIDSLPEDPKMIWDIPITAGFAERLVSWRGNGTDTANQFVPAVFYLQPGPHRLTIIGREGSVQLGRISIEPEGATGQHPLPPSRLRLAGS